MRIIRLLVIVALVLALAVLAAGQAGLLRGTAPGDLGVRDGRLKAPSTTANSVSSQAALWPGHPQASYSTIEPLALRGDAVVTMTKLRELIEASPGGKVVETRSDYLRAEFTTRWLGFVDDAEFWFDAQGNAVQVRSASRVGRKDFGVNRARIEAIRQALAAG